MKVTHACRECGTKRMTRFEDETFHIDYRGRTTEVKALSGWRCASCGEVQFDVESAERYGQASDDLVLATRWHETEETQ